MGLCLGTSKTRHVVFDKGRELQQLLALLALAVAVEWEQKAGEPAEGCLGQGAQFVPYTAATRAIPCPLATTLGKGIFILSLPLSVCACV